METPEIKPKSPHAEREERILAFWNKEGIFEKSLAKESPKGEFVFYEGPPTANGRPGLHHLEARAFKDAIPRYRTMRGFHVRRKGGWDTHGLPVEIQVQKELGLKSKKDIEAYGLEAFNEKCKESVWTYVHEWEDFTKRMGYWVDLKNPYITYKPDYMESLWNILKTADDKKLLYKDYRVVPWCPHDETVLSSHELAQGYETVKDLSVYVMFKVKKPKQAIKNSLDEYLLAWTTTPWTLPGNVALAVGKNIEYVKARIWLEASVGNYPKNTESRYVYIARSVLESYQKGPTEGSYIFSNGVVLSIENGNYGIKGEELVGLEYEPLYPFLKDNVSGAEKEKLANAFKVYAADFVTTTDGTGIVHIAPMYGQDDFELGTKAGLPKYHLVNEDGTFKKEAGFLAGKFVKDEGVAVEIIKDLANRPSGSLLFHKEKHEHTYPFCWRCKTPLIYFARDSWYIRMSELRDDLVKENEGIGWEPAHIKEGRFGEWLKEVKDWAISRERYWGTPLPVWICETCKKRKVAGSVADVSKKPKNTYYVMRHGEAENNLQGIFNSDPSKEFHLSALGKEQVRESAAAFKGSVDLIVSSPFLRTKETAEVCAETLGFDKAKISFDERIREMHMGELEGEPNEAITVLYPTREEFFTGSAKGVENRNSIKRRMGAFLEDMETRHEGKNVLIISHDGPLWMLEAAAQGLDIQGSLALKPKGMFYLRNAEMRKLDFSVVPHNADYELDLHRPFIDAVKLSCPCGGEMSRVKEVMDVWFDSGAMPFAQDHYPFEGQEAKKRGMLAQMFSRKDALPYPADFISEAIDQTRGWFYTLHAIGTIMGKGKAYKNVICLGHILDASGKKMSKSVGNVISPWDMMDKYGADALRFWMYSINQPGDSKNFDEKTVDEIVKKVFNLAANVTTFYKTYAAEAQSGNAQDARGSQDILDRWIIARLDQLVENATRNLDAYVLMEPARAVRDFIADLSQWYLRRSRDRFKNEGADKLAALATTKYVLVTLAKVMAPFTPFFAEELYLNVGGPLQSVHLENWPVAGKIEEKLLKDMETVRLVSSKGLEARMKAKINVRQPLSKLSVQNPKLKIDDARLIELIKAEVNVKEVLFNEAIATEVELDTALTPELKEEGMVRELVRAVQDLRKEKDLTVNDKAVLLVDADERGKAFIEKNRAELSKVTLLNDVKFVPLKTEPFEVGDCTFKIDL